MALSLANMEACTSNSTSLDLRHKNCNFRVSLYYSVQIYKLMGFFFKKRKGKLPAMLGETMAGVCCPHIDSTLDMLTV